MRREEKESGAIETLHGTIGIDHPDYGEFYKCREMMAFQFYDAVREDKRRSGRKWTEKALRKGLNELLYGELAPIVLRYHEQQWPWAIHAVIAEKIDNYSGDGSAETPPPPHQREQRASFWARLTKGLR